MGRLSSFPEGLFKLLLKLFAESFRERHGRDLLRLYRDCWQDSARRSWLFRASLLWDVVKSGLETRWELVRPALGGRHRAIPVQGRSLPANIHVRRDTESFMGIWLKDLRFAWRALIKRPGLTASAVAALALGIGLTTAMYSIVDGVVLKGLPFEDSDRIVHLFSTNLQAGIDRMPLSAYDFLEWQEQATSLEELAGYRSVTFNLGEPDLPPARYSGVLVTHNLFHTLRVRPVLGRDFTPEDDRPGAEAVLILGHHVWRERFQSDPAVLGRVVRIHGEPATIIGVMPEGFGFPLRDDLWMPLRLDRAAVTPAGSRNLDVVARLAPGADQAALQRELPTLAGRLETAYPDSHEGIGARFLSYAVFAIEEEAAMILYTLFGAVFSVLLVACANVANLLLALAVVRGREMSIRSALGASRKRLVVQLLSESLLISAIGGALGLALAQLGVHLFNDALLRAPLIPFWFDIRIDQRVFGFILALTVLTSLLAGLVPALKASAANLRESLSDEGRGGSSLRLGRFSKGLVVAEVALSCALLVPSGLMVRSIIELGRFDPGFATEDVLTATITLPKASYAEADDRRRFLDELRRDLEGRAGVEALTLSSGTPGDYHSERYFGVDGTAYASDADYPYASTARVAPGFFAALGSRVIRGRDFSSSDDADSPPVVLVNESFANLYLAGREAIGQRLRLGRSRSERPFMTVIGVVPDLSMGGVQSGLAPGFYVPIAQMPPSTVRVLLRTTGDPLALTAAVREAVATIDANLPVYEVATLADVVAKVTWFYGVFGAMFMIFGGIGLLLAAIGLYGVLAFSVSRRRWEMGLRSALGARASDLMRLIFRQGLAQLALGLGLGTLAALFLGKLLGVLLFQVDPWDPSVFGAVALLLAATGAVACLVPALRAKSVDPAVALRDS